MNKFYVYAYVDPRNHKPFYIGKGCDLRWQHHLNETKNNTENRKKYAYIQGLRNKNLEPIIYILFNNLKEEKAYEIETKLISIYGRKDIDEGGILMNICADNRPPVFYGRPVTKETREKISKAQKGKPRPKTSGKNNYFYNKHFIGELNHFYGKTHSEKTKEIMREKAKNREPNRIGIKHTEESKRKMSENNGSKRPEVREKIKRARAKQKITNHKKYVVITSNNNKFCIIGLRCLQDIIDKKFNIRSLGHFIRNESIINSRTIPELNGWLIRKI